MISRAAPVFVLTAAAVAVANAQLASTFWPKYLGFNANSGNPTISGTLPILKAQYFQNNSVDGSLSIGTDGRLYTILADGEVVAIDPGTGNTATIATGANTFDATPSIDTNGNLIYFSASGLCSTNSQTGILNWTNTDPGSASGCSAALGTDGSIYVVTNGIYSINGSSGVTNWIQTYDGFYDSPAIGPDGTVYVNGDSALYALNPSDGSEKWVYPTSGGAFGNTPTVGPNGNVYATDGNGDVFELDSSTGVPIWLQNVGTSINGAPAIAPNGDVIVTSFNGVFAFDGSGNPLWSADSGDFFYAAPIVDANGTVYALNSNSTAYAFEGDNGNILWSYNGPGGVIGFSPMLGTDGTLYVPSDGGGSGSSGVYAFDTFNNATLSFDSSTISGGSGTTATLTLPGTVFADVTISLRSQSPQYITVPSSVTISSGSSSVTFPVTAKAYTSNYTLNVNATYDGANISAPLTVTGDHVASVSLNPSSVVGGTTTSGMVTLANPAPAGGWMVNLASDNPNYVSVQSYVEVQPGNTTANFTVSTQRYYLPYSTTIVASDAGSKKGATLQVVNDSIASVSLNPAEVAGGNSTTGTVTLNAPAPTGGYTVNLTSGNPGYVGVPSTVTILAGQTTANFNVTTKAFYRTYSTTISATDTSTKKGATITVIPAISP